jgi:hypothetical protein
MSHCERPVRSHTGCAELSGVAHNHRIHRYHAAKNTGEESLGLSALAGIRIVLDSAATPLLPISILLLPVPAMPVPLDRSAANPVAVFSEPLS